MAVSGSVKEAQGRVISSGPLPDEDAFAEEDCLCQGKVPADKRMDFEQRVFDEKRNKHRWKAVLRYHQDCPVHGCNRSE